MSTVIKNRAPAEIQVTAEQLVRTARDSVVEDEARIEKLKISTRVTDTEELKMHQAEKRRDYEEKLRHTMVNAGAYIRYAKWEESQLEFRRSRSIYERLLEGENQQYSIWIKYAEFEMRNKFVNHARNVLDRAVTILPRSSHLWYKYTYMEEMLGQVDKTRLVFERWMEWEPSEECWASYINFEVRHKELAKAREVYERFCGCFPTTRSYVKYAKWEERHGQLALARSVFERALDELPLSENKKQRLFVEFAQFETRCKEFKRARAIFKQSLDILPAEDSRELYQAFVTFERQFGDRDSIESVLVTKKRDQYETKLETDKFDYDTWFEYIRLEQAHALAEAAAATENPEQHARVLVQVRTRVRQVYQRAVEVIPPSKTDKRLWQRYIYLWINYAVFEELHLQDVNKARKVYEDCLACIPHKHFSFTKIWILAANLEVRQKDITAARKILGQAIGRCPSKNKIFRAYIQLELQLGNVERCRTLYEKYLEYAPHNCQVWQKYADLEFSVGEEDRSRSILNLAVNQPVLDMPENLWKGFIDFEVQAKQLDNATLLYERLLERTQHVKIWTSYARFLASLKKDMPAVRSLLEKSLTHFKKSDDISAKEDRAVICMAWLQLEQQYGDALSIEKVRKMQPNKVKRRRKIDTGFEEYFDYVFPDDKNSTPGLKLLQLAQNWKRDAENPLKKPKTADENEIDLDDI